MFLTMPDYACFPHILANFTANLSKFAVTLAGQNDKMATEVSSLCMVTLGMNDDLAYDWHNMAKKMLQKDRKADGK